MKATMRRWVIASVATLVLVSVSGFSFRGSRETVATYDASSSLNAEAAALQQSGLPAGGAGWERLFMSYGR